MICREFESQFEGYLEQRLPAQARLVCDAHLAVCGSCRELVELANLPAEVPAPGAGDLVNAVLGRTSGPACVQAEHRLALLVDGELSPDGDRELLSAHVAQCATCSGLVAELERLAVELSRLASVRPEESLVEGVLRRTLPAPVLWRRWWRTAWPHWVRRPRFAVEFAYAATLVVVLVFGAPVSPLQAMSERAFELARNQPVRLEAVRSVARDEIGSRVGRVLDGGAQRARGLAAGTRQRVGTILEKVASWFENAEDEPTAEPTPTKEETS